jgi:hypothetical protein
MSDWTCKIVEADFEANTLTLEMSCEDYVVSAKTHYLRPADQAPEPVGFTIRDDNSGVMIANISDLSVPEYAPLYLAPPNAEQIRAKEQERCAKYLEAMSDLWAPSTLLEMAKRIRGLK